MKKTSWGFIAVIVGIILVLGMIFAGKYNSFVNAEESVNQSAAQIDNQLQRRADLIPNLVNTVKGYSIHEKEVLTQIANARAKLAGAQTKTDQANADAELSGALSRLLVISENYPELKADKQFTQLMDELAGTENRIATARMDYNKQVETFNKEIKRFPGSIIASMGGFKAKDYFKAEERAKQVPQVNFGETK
ncbi:LemA protein [Aneurinibacillus soli]|uniref:LemA family protein n=1 Tax=Aneurinibacillus soli TaxID=1500254 RepID=A0A0U4WAU8_9BACL|nr:LemA family protein [Aneurinibacillus soli]PYE58960.1 LemA protein [Aneurinibacillus soli]BAU26024.1 LemA family protein [Aneurinibacillus soli]